MALNLLTIKCIHFPANPPTPSLLTHTPTPSLPHPSTHPTSRFPTPFLPTRPHRAPPPAHPLHQIISCIHDPGQTKWWSGGLPSPDTRARKFPVEGAHLGTGVWLFPPNICVCLHQLLCIYVCLLTHGVLRPSVFCLFVCLFALARVCAFVRVCGPFLSVCVKSCTHLYAYVE